MHLAWEEPFRSHPVQRVEKQMICVCETDMVRLLHLTTYFPTATGNSQRCNPQLDLIDLVNVSTRSLINTSFWVNQTNRLATSSQSEPSRGPFWPLIGRLALAPCNRISVKSTSVRYPCLSSVLVAVAAVTITAGPLSLDAQLKNGSRSHLAAFADRWERKAVIGEKDMTLRSARRACKCDAFAMSFWLCWNLEMPDLLPARSCLKMGNSEARLTSTCGYLLLPWKRGLVAICRPSQHLSYIHTSGKYPKFMGSITHHLSRDVTRTEIGIGQDFGICNVIPGKTLLLLFQMTSAQLSPLFAAAFCVNVMIVTWSLSVFTLCWVFFSFF